jgi:hypothetical protein
MPTPDRTDRSSNENITRATPIRSTGPHSHTCYRWLAHPVTDAEVAETYRVNALYDAHQDHGPLITATANHQKGSSRRSGVAGEEPGMVPGGFSGAG